MQNLTLQVNRPFGWSFHGITNGEIKYMKLWQVSIVVIRLPPEDLETLSPSP